MWFCKQWRPWSDLGLHCSPVTLLGVSRLQSMILGLCVSAGHLSGKHVSWESYHTINWVIGCYCRQRKYWLINVVKLRLVEFISLLYYYVHMVIYDSDNGLMLKWCWFMFLYYVFSLYVLMVYTFIYRHFCFASPYTISIICFWESWYNVLDGTKNLETDEDKVNNYSVYM